MLLRLNDNVNKYVAERINEFYQIPEARKLILKPLADYIRFKEKERVNLTFICTHNSRRSYFGQIWGQTAASYYNADNVHCYSGGTEATAFNPRAVKAIKKAGFEIEESGDATNPTYSVSYDERAEALKCFSKVYNDEYNPQENFVAVMTCSHADENCPFIPGADNRFAITYNDPKEFDGTDLEEEKYDERCAEIAREMLFVFHSIKSKSH